MTTQRDMDLMLVEAMVENMKIYQEWRDEHFGVEDAFIHGERRGELGVNSGKIRKPTELPGANEGQPRDLGTATGNDNQYPEVLR